MQRIGLPWHLINMAVRFFQWMDKVFTYWILLTEEEDPETVSITHIL